MRVTIVPPDGVVIIDGVARNLIDLSFMSGIHAVQWYGTWGDVERVNADFQHTNERIESLAPYQAAIDGWNNWVAPAPEPWPPVAE